MQRGQKETNTKHTQTHNGTQTKSIKEIGATSIRGRSSDILE
jgi:hypothetical protein